MILIRPVRLTFVHERLRLLQLLAGGCLIGLVSSCSTDGNPVAQSGVSVTSTTQSIRQTDAQGRRLPFMTRFPNRWNIGNDGTTYEPCTAVAPSVLVSAGLDPSTAQDAALADFQTLRGCRWLYAGSTLGSVSQIVANAENLDAYKQRQSDVLRWFPDQSINGRRVAVGAFHAPGMCIAIVASGKSHVASTVSLPTDTPPIADICAKAVDFTRATIDQIPE
ncbi:DUF3558 domain-containing protein [Gordonia sp. NPDC003425]